VTSVSEPASHHPDTVGSIEKFNRVLEAEKILLSG
jgi:hypothetical protein